MFLYTRGVTLRGSPRQVLPWVSQITEYVNSKTSLGVTAWNADFGHPIGTIVWNALVESQAALSAETSQLLGDEGYADLLEAASDLVAAPGEDGLARLVHGSPSEPPALGSVAMVTSAHAIVDRIGDTLAWSVDIAQHVESVTGSPISVWSSVYGQMGEMAFIGVNNDPAALDASDEAISTDDGYYERLHKSAGLWVEGSGHVARYTRIA